ncbi:MAG TPA: aminoacyl-tRNA hydrolase, partial [Novosphingobium sp.]|nr:aminoacyl-tRNA hydrolase [Novosphingobium sp.]
MSTSADEATARALALASESFIAASGPGGQNVNKVASAVQLRLNVYALALPVPVFARFKQLAGSRMTARGELVLTA